MSAELPEPSFSIIGPVCVWIARLPRGARLPYESLTASERAAARRYARAGDRACFVASRALRRRVLSTFAQQEPESLQFASGCERCGDPRHGRPRLVGHDGISFSCASAWVESEDSHAIVVTVARGVDVGVDVAADEAVAELAPDAYLAPGERPLRPFGPAASWAAKEALLKLAGGTGHFVDPRAVRIEPDVELPAGLGGRVPGLDLSWRPLPGACVAVAWAPRGTFAARPLAVAA